ncbi:hypothetical protein Tco_1568082, partial [Tanacetum coccineum]
TPPEILPLRHDFGGVTDWYQSTGYRELGTIYRQKDKNDAKTDKIEHGLESAGENEAEGIFIFNGPTRCTPLSPLLFHQHDKLTSTSIIPNSRQALSVEDIMKRGSKGSKLLIWDQGQD